MSEINHYIYFNNRIIITNFCSKIVFLHFNDTLAILSQRAITVSVKFFIEGVSALSDMSVGQFITTVIEYAQIYNLEMTYYLV